MKINGKHEHTIWLDTENPGLIHVFDQRYLPHSIRIFNISTTDDAVYAIREMVVRGAPLIGVTAAYGMYLGCREALDRHDPTEYLAMVGEKLKGTRPTAVNLVWAINEVMDAIAIAEAWSEKISLALKRAHEIKEEDISTCQRIGLYGVELIKQITSRKEGAVNILTHCNAGWLATVDWGTALSPVYHAQKEGIEIHVWVDETRPRNQGASLTTFELVEQGIPHTLITDNTGGHLMQQGMVDIVIVGTDRTARNGDVANKIGTYLKALAAHDNNVPFYVALPSSSLDVSIKNGVQDIPIEERDADEVKYVRGLDGAESKSVLISPKETQALNYGFDVTPAKYVTGLITERGICEASEEGIKILFPEKFD